MEKYEKKKIYKIKPQTIKKKAIGTLVQSLSRVWLFATPWTAANQASLSITNSWSLPKLMSIESVMPSNHLILCCPLLLPPSIFPSITVFSSESALRIRWPKYWSFSFSISPSSEYSGLISFRMHWLVGNRNIYINNYFKCKQIKCSNQRQRLNEYKNKTHIYAVYKKPTSDLKSHIDWKWEDGKIYSMQMESKGKLE